MGVSPKGDRPKLIDGKTAAQDVIDREWGARTRARAFTLWRELTGAGIVETEPRYAHVDGLAVPIQPSDRPYFLEVQARRAKVSDYDTLMFGTTQYERMLSYYEDLGFPTVLIAIWSDGLGHIQLPCPHGEAVVGHREVNGQKKVMLDIDQFAFVRPDRFEKHFPPEFFS